MRRRLVGVGAIQSSAVDKARFSSKGDQLARTQLAELTRQLEVFKQHLESYARHHRKQIRKDSELRRQFQDMCLMTGVDPLASRKTLLSDILGIGDFYFDLSVKILEICIALADRTGGLVRTDLLVGMLKNERICEDDIERIVGRLSVLGVKIVCVDDDNARTRLVQVYPSELGIEQINVLKVLSSSETGLTIKEICEKCKWTTDVANVAVRSLVIDGVVWVDNFDQTYWVASFFVQQNLQSPSAISDASSS